jgi:hypothetical protein
LRRKVKTLSTLLPKHLGEYDSTSWEGRDEAERYGQWMDAREAWKDERGIFVLPDDEAAHAAFPDGEWRIEDL